MLKYKMKKKEDEEIKVLKKELGKYKKRPSKLNKNTPHTKLQEIADTPEFRNDRVK